MHSPIADHVLPSNLWLAALVHRDACIDRLCLPWSDAAACFAALFDTPEHDCWSLRPQQQ